MKCDKETTPVKLDTFFDEGKYAEFVEGNQKEGYLLWYILRYREDELACQYIS